MFKFIWKFQEKIMDWGISHTAKISSHKKVFIVLNSAMIVLLISAAVINNIVLIFMSILGLIIISAVQKIDYLQSNLTHMRKFISFSLNTICFFFLMFITFSSLFDNTIKSYVIIVLWTFGPSLVYSIVTLFANMKMATLVNGVGTLIIGIVSALISYVISFIPSHLFNDFFLITNNNSLVLLFQKLGLVENGKDVFQILFGVISTPLILMFATATCVCFIKKYWIEKHNKDKDILSREDMKEILSNLYEKKNIQYNNIENTYKDYNEWADEVKRLKEKQRLNSIVKKNTKQEFVVQYNNGVEIVCKKVKKGIVIKNIISRQKKSSQKNGTNALEDFLKKLKKRDVYLAVPEIEDKIDRHVLFEEDLYFYFPMTCETLGKWFEKLGFVKTSETIGEKTMSYVKKGI